ncbi:MAG: hypothetical protein U0Z17_07025 [Bacteroidales bacterium]
MKNKYFLIAAITLVAFSTGSDVLNKVGTDTQTMKERVCQNINNNFSLSTVVYSLSAKACKALPVTERAAVVNAIGELVKTYINSDAFSKDYETYVRNQYADYEKPNAQDPQWKEAEKRYYAELVESQENMEKLGMADYFKANIDTQLEMYKALLGSISEESTAELCRLQGYTEENLKEKVLKFEKMQTLFETDKKGKLQSICELFRS